MTEKNTSEKIHGIRCDCVNCAYHATDDSCHADSITVGSCDATHCSDTCCETFCRCKERDY